MSKRKNVRKTVPDERTTYQPRLNATQQAISHRQASADYYRRNIVQEREKRRIQVAERRAAAKLKKRRWDPPKGAVVRQTTAHTSDHAGTRNEPLDLPRSFAYEVPDAITSDGGALNAVASAIPDTPGKTSSTGLVGNFEEPETASKKTVFGEGQNNRTTSPTLEERIAIEALTNMHRVQLLHEGERSDSDISDSILVLAQMLTSPSAESDSNLAAAARQQSSGLLNESLTDRIGELNPRRAATAPVVVSGEMRTSHSILTGMHLAARQALESTGILEESVRARVVDLNNRQSSAPPTAVEMQQWLDSGRDLGQHGNWMSSAREAAVQLWCNSVARSSREGNISQSGSQESESVRSEQQFYDYHKV
ncbi:hypothetical protein C8J57DRAFT_1514873 [Mycena rebaudengoi]|nr:hypothetical protein C8J57DRAFT_1514873 [Mycena rebaudengoi]